MFTEIKSRRFGKRVINQTCQVINFQVFFIEKQARACTVQRARLSNDRCYIDEIDLFRRYNVP